MPTEDEDAGKVPNRLWRIEYRVDAIERHLGFRNGSSSQQPQPQHRNGGMYIPITVVYAVLALVVALATGQFAHFIGLFG